MRITISDLRFTARADDMVGTSRCDVRAASSGARSVVGRRIAHGSARSARAVTAQRAVPTVSTSAFTMMEIAISLAIIGIALVAIIGVLPIGMNVQQDNRQETIIGQDAGVFMEAIRNGSVGLDDLTNYVYAITNYWQRYDVNAVPAPIGPPNGYTYTAGLPASGYYTLSVSPLTNGANIIGLLSTPEFTDLAGNPTNNLYNGGYSNHIVAYCRSLSGPAYEKPPQDNPIVQQDSFSYRIYCVNAPFPVNTNDYLANAPTPYDLEMSEALHEVRLTFLWPQRPNGSLGSGRETFRTLVAGEYLHLPPFSPANPNALWNPNLYYYVPQTFTNAL